MSEPRSSLHRASKPSDRLLAAARALLDLEECRPLREWLECSLHQAQVALHTQNLLDLTGQRIGTKAQGQIALITELLFDESGNVV